MERIMEKTILSSPPFFLWGAVPGAPKKRAGTLVWRSRHDSPGCPGGLGLTARLAADWCRQCLWRRWPMGVSRLGRRLSRHRMGGCGL